MNNANEYQGNRMHYWGLKFLIAAVLMIIGHQSPVVWLSICAVIWAVYLITFIASPLLVAASQNTSVARISKRTLSVLGNIATAALISAPVVMFHWYRVTYLSGR